MSEKRIHMFLLVGWWCLFLFGLARDSWQTAMLGAVLWLAYTMRAYVMLLKR